MAWQQILGFFTMWLHPEITIGLWSGAGVPMWQTFLYTICWTSLTLSLTYLGTSWLKNLFKNMKGARDAIESIERFYRKNSLKLNNGKYHKKLLNNLVRQKNWLILACGFIPFVYGLPATVIVVAKLMEIKHAFWILLLGNCFRNGIICLLIYQGFKIFS